MEEIVEFRLSAQRAAKYLKPTDGQLLSELVRKVVTKVGSSLYERIRLGEQDLLASGKEGIYYSCWLTRTYTPDEINHAELFTLGFKKTFEPSGDECGTVYDESSACRHIFSFGSEVAIGRSYIPSSAETCGGGGRIVGPLVLDLRKAPKKHTIARTIADEYVVSQSLAEWFLKERITGCELRPVVHKAYLDDEPFDLKESPTGRELLQEAEAEGIAGWRLNPWLYSPEREARTRQAEQECRFSQKMKALLTSPPRWYELVITSRPVRIVPPTRWGRDIFGHYPPDKYCCAHAGDLNHVADLNIFSEVSVAREDWDGADICRSVQLIGNRAGVLRPAPVLFVSSKMRKVMTNYAKASTRFDVAHFVGSEGA